MIAAKLEWRDTWIGGYVRGASYEWGETCVARRINAAKCEWRDTWIQWNARGATHECGKMWVARHKFEARTTAPALPVLLYFRLFSYEIR